MCTSWVLNTNGDPLSIVRDFLRSLWPYACLEGMLIPCFQAESNAIVLHLMESPLQLDQAYPLIPLVPVNAAKSILELARTHPQARFAAILRSCEARALTNMHSRFPTKFDNWFIIGIDCLSSFPIEDFEWRLARAGGIEQLSRGNFRFARQGGIAPYRYRRACQMCANPAAQQADLCICLLGLPVSEYVLVRTKDAAIANSLHLDEITGGPAAMSQIAQHEHMLHVLGQRRDRCRERMVGGLASDLPTDPIDFVNLIGNCAPCQNCLEVCPLYAGELEGISNYNLSVSGEVSNWLAACVACGMCEQACPSQLPLTAIHVRILRELVPQRLMAVT